MRVFNHFLISALVFVFCLSCSQQDFNNIAKNKINEFLQEHPYISTTYKIDIDSDVLAEGAVGYYDRETSQLLQENQQMPIASGTKQMTAALILKLQEQGILTLSDTIVKFIPENSEYWPESGMPEWAKEITIHNLLTHTSGIAEYIPLLSIDIDKSHEEINKQISHYAAQTPLSNIPGQKYSYSNTGYFYLGIILESIHKKELATIFDEELFKPLGMTNSRMANLEETLKFQKGEIQGYPKRYFGIPASDKPSIIPANVDFFVVPFSDGGVLSTVTDLVIWNRAFHNGDVVSDYSYKLMTTPYYEVKDPFRENVRIGYGVYITELSNGNKVYYHSGNAVGIRSEHGYIPDAKIYFAMLSNVMPYETDDIKGKVDYRKSENQFDIIFFKKLILGLADYKLKN